MSSSVPSPLHVFDSPELEADVDAAIAACGGDARGAVRALIVANGFLAAELEALLKNTSRGYGRGRPRTKPPAPED